MCHINNQLPNLMIDCPQFAHATFNKQTHILSYCLRKAQFVSFLAMQAVVRGFLIVLVTALFLWQVEATGLSNFINVKVENRSWTNDYLRSQNDGSPV